MTLTVLEKFEKLVENGLNIQNRLVEKEDVEKEVSALFL
jgi:hypothetical protein